MRFGTKVVDIIYKKIFYIIRFKEKKCSRIFLKLGYWKSVIFADLS